jgi:hypothetical protein
MHGLYGGGLPRSADGANRDRASSAVQPRPSAFGFAPWLRLASLANGLAGHGRSEIYAARHDKGGFTGSRPAPKRMGWAGASARLGSAAGPTPGSASPSDANQLTVQSGVVYCS